MSEALQSEAKAVVQQETAQYATDVAVLRRILREVAQQEPRSASTPASPVPTAAQLDAAIEAVHQYALARNTVLDERIREANQILDNAAAATAAAEGSGAASTRPLSALTQELARGEWLSTTGIAPVLIDALIEGGIVEADERGRVRATVANS